MALSAVRAVPRAAWAARSVAASAAAEPSKDRHLIDHLRARIKVRRLVTEAQGAGSWPPVDCRLHAGGAHESPRGGWVPLLLHLFF
jgi:hypothetical protein